MKIREHESPDLERCRALWAEMVGRHREIYDDPSIGGDDPGLEFDEHLAQVGADSVWLATLGEEIVGLVSLIKKGQEAEVEPIVVSSQHRGQGIGQRLLDHATAQAREAGVLCLGVKPVARNEAAVAFFHAAGFNTLGHLHLFKWLGPPIPGQWKTGPEIFGRTFDY